MKRVLLVLSAALLGAGIALGAMDAIGKAPQARETVRSVGYTK